MESGILILLKKHSLRMDKKQSKNEQRHKYFQASQKLTSVSNIISLLADDDTPI